jgi:hypothetical protein
MRHPSRSDKLKTFLEEDWSFFKEWSWILYWKGFTICSFLLMICRCCISSEYSLSHPASSAAAIIIES